MRRKLVTIFALLMSTLYVCAQHTERDVAYGPASLQRLDLTTPSKHHFATIIFVHGGSLNSGDKADSDYGSVCSVMVQRGIGCAAVNYRLFPEAAWPAPAEDLASAIAWVRANIQKRGGDPKKL